MVDYKMNHIDTTESVLRKKEKIEAIIILSIMILILTGLVIYLDVLHNTTAPPDPKMPCVMTTISDDYGHTYPIKTCGYGHLENKN